jgi:protein ImuB
MRDRQLGEALVQVARRFSPEVEQSGSGQTVTFSITPLRQMIGSPHQIASEICHAGHAFKLQASLAMASNPDSAILLARHFMGVTMVTPGEERLRLAPIPLAEIFEYDPVKLAPSMLEILLRWGVKTCEELALLPEKGVAERLGSAGVYLHKLACGHVRRPLRLRNEGSSYEMQMEMEHSLELLEPLLFLLSRSTGELCQRLRSQARAARELELQLELDTQPLEDEKTLRQPALEITKTYRCRLEFPVPLDDPRIILKLLQLHLERHAPGAPVRSFRLRLEPVEPKRIQGGIFLPPTPAPDKLHVTMARIAGMVGAENVGTPVLLNTHRPDAFTNHLLPGQAKETARFRDDESKPEMLRLAMRLFRPALHARVQVVKLTPRNVLAEGVRGQVMRYAGPWKTAGEWWTDTAWSREEWDVALDDGALYRIYLEAASNEWFVHGIYD